MWIKDDVEVVIFNIYSPCDLGSKKRLWKKLVELKRSLCKVWCILGDFNYAKRCCEKQGECVVDVGNGEKREFNHFIGDMELEDAPVVGRKFTWFPQNGKAMSRIDKFLVIRKWNGIWEGCSQYVFDINVSDPCPLVLRNEKVDWGPKPFMSLDC